MMFQDFESPPLDATAWTTSRISQLRKILLRRSIDAYVVPRADAHQGEYVAACDARLSWLTGFTGSAGTAVIGRSRSALIVDGRYTLQARTQVAQSGIEVVDIAPHALDDWLASTCQSGAVVGVDPRLIPLAQAERLNAALSRFGFKLRAVERNLVDMVWGKARPQEPDGAITVQPEDVSGQSAEDKIRQLQETLRSDGDDACLLTLPDSICWLLNIRGRDVSHTPIVRCFAVVPKRGKIELFLYGDRPGKRIDAATRSHISKHARLRQVSELRDHLKLLKSRDARVRVDPTTAGWWCARQLGNRNLHRADDPCQHPKAIKNPVEIAGTRAAHLRDGAAMARFLAWLDRETEAGSVDEIAAARQLEEFRRETGALEDVSFDTISGAGPNGAIVHYRVTEATNRKLGKGELYLVDSGGQYRDGTTDITRTVAVGRPTKDMRRNFTLVLQGHIAISTARFPNGTRGLDLDPLARVALWNHGLDYGHGTGHGVGSFLSVHEGPQSISRRGQHVLEAGMIISNEPGYYKEGAYGIRIENLVLVRPFEPVSGGDRDMASFEVLTLAPIDTRLVDLAVLTEDERTWLNAYHARVLKEIGPLVDRATRAWLKTACAAV